MNSLQYRVMGAVGRTSLPERLARWGAGVIDAAAPRWNSGRVRKAISVLHRIAGRPGRPRPAFRLLSELEAAGVGGRHYTELLERLDELPRYRKRELLTGWFSSVGRAWLRRSQAEHRHVTSPGVHPPPVRDFILTTTSRCNLSCVGCYTASQRSGADVPEELIDQVLEQGKALGLFRVHLVGKGEPFMNAIESEKTLRILARHPDLQFTVFTNGVAIKQRHLERLGRLSNTMLFFSLNGRGELNDRSRGKGVFDAVLRAMAAARAHHVPFGFSATVTAENYEEVTSNEFVGEMARAGSSMGVYFKYVRLDPSAPTELALTGEEVVDYSERLAHTGAASPIVLVDPDIFERGLGCRARSGTLLYVDLVSGRVSPCVRTPFSPEACDIRQGFHSRRLAEVLMTPFFRRYREGAASGRTCSSHGSAELDWFARQTDLPTSQRDAARREASAPRRVALPIVSQR